jgi:Zn-dependent membrane protease YugP
MYMLPVMLVMMLVQWYVNSAYNKWSQVPARSRMRAVLRLPSLYRRAGYLGAHRVSKGAGDHYDPR